jgi:hypothetical protein
MNRPVSPAVPRVLMSKRLPEEALVSTNTPETTPGRNWAVWIGLAVVAVIIVGLLVYAGGGGSGGGGGGY